MKSTPVVNKKKTITSFSTDCQQAVSGLFSPLPATRPRTLLPLHCFLPRPLHPIFGPLRSHSTHMFCVRVSRRKQCKTS